MEKVIEEEYRLTIEAGSLVEWGSQTRNCCRLHYPDGILEAAEILVADESALLNLLCRRAYLEVNGKLYMITEPQKMEWIENTVFVRLLSYRRG
jgi:hypothetical protein